MYEWMNWTRTAVGMATGSRFGLAGISWLMTYWWGWEAMCCRQRCWLPHAWMVGWFFYSTKLPEVGGRVDAKIGAWSVVHTFFRTYFLAAHPCHVVT